MKINGLNHFHRFSIFTTVVVCLLVLVVVQGCHEQIQASAASVAITTKEQPVVSTDPLKWPTQTNQNRPWARWWWMGSAVDETGLTYALTEYSRAGLGGVEICPVYGAKGYENQFKDFLSPQWMDMLAHTTKEARRLDMGVDMTAGTGWPFGGPWITEETASSSLVLREHELSEGQSMEGILPSGRLQYAVAVSDSGQHIDLTEKAKSDPFSWTAPRGNWKIYIIFQKGPAQKVKRAAPGGAGFVVDPYSITALDSYLAPFDNALIGYQGQMPRCYFQDSFEYFGATWTAHFFDEFKLRRGYDLRDQIEALFSDGDEDTIVRVQSDYRRTISDLHLDFIRHWTQWSHSHGSMTREQAHGAPANLLDLYAAVDIPDTEIFREVDNRQIPLLGFASSAADLKGSSLVAAESFTWLKNHFQASLSDVKPAADFLFLAGVNHIFFHGIPYSPPQAQWPGWQFYASVNFGPTGGLWHDLSAFNAYVARCQSILQSGSCGNEILLYFPMDDIWHTTGSLSLTFTIHTDGRTGSQSKWLWPTPFYQTAMGLYQNGYPTNYISDSFIQQARCANGKIELNGNTYSVLIVPACQKMPVETMKQLLALAKAGATIIFEGAMPTDVPGFYQFQKRQAAMQKLLTGISFDKRVSDAVTRAELGKGRLLRGNAQPALSAVGIAREPMAEAGLQFLRRKHPEGWYYFVVNSTDKTFDGWVTLATDASAIVLMDPYFENQIGMAATRKRVDEKTEVYLQLTPGQSCILRTFTSRPVTGPAWNYWKSGAPLPVDGTWKVKFTSGGPTLPEPYETKELTSWTTQPDAEAQRFAGTARYTLEFELTDNQADDWMLDLGSVGDSARVFINSRPVAVLWAKPFTVRIGQYLIAGKNRLQVDVTNVAANRIRDLDQRKVQWKYFYDANVLNQEYKAFDASDWPLRDSGLLGPVTVTPLTRVTVMPVEDKSRAALPTLWIIGDSTVRNGTKGLLGWGDPIAAWFDANRINVRNRALGGRSSRTYQTEGLWDKVLAEMKPGDFVLVQFGHNDNGPLNTGRARASLHSNGDETQEVIMESTGNKEVVHSYGWYLRKYIADTKAKGATPIILSLVPRNMWSEDGKTVNRATNDFTQWASDAAKQGGAAFIDLNNIIARHYEADGQEKVKTQYFLTDHTHTTTLGAELNAACVVEGLRSLKDCALTDYLLTLPRK